MKRSLFAAALPILLAACGSGPGPGRAVDAPPAAGSLRELPAAAYADRVLGAWFGWASGARFGAGSDGAANGCILNGPLRPIDLPPVPEALAATVLAPALTRLGPDAFPLAAARDFAATTDPLGRGADRGRGLLRRAVLPPWSGHPACNGDCDDLDFMAGAWVIGLACPGMPLESDRLCEIHGRLMAHRDGLYAGMFVAGMMTEAVLAADPSELPRVLDAGLACIPPDCATARLVGEAVRARAESPDSWWPAWRRIEASLQGPTPVCCDNAAAVNAAYVVLGLLYGGGDPARTLEVTTRCGRRSGVNAAVAGAVLGALGETRGIRWKPLADEALPALAVRLAETGRTIVTAGGGEAPEAGPLRIVLQRPAPPEGEARVLYDAERERMHDMRIGLRGAVLDWECRSGVFLPAAREFAGAAEIPFELAGPSSLSLRVFLRRRPGGARVVCAVDGKPIGAALNLNGDALVVSHESDAHAFGAGRHTLTLTADGGRPFGVYGYDLVPVPKAVTTWKLSPAFPAPGDSGFNAVFPPETAAEPEKLEGWTDAKVNADGAIDIKGQRTPGDDAVAYALTTLHASGAFESRLLVGSDDGVKIWLNGKLVHQNHAHRPMVGGDDVAPVRFEPGDNRLLVKIEQGAGDWLLKVEVEDPEGKLEMK